jgi:hypothetical protein
MTGVGTYLKKVEFLYFISKVETIPAKQNKKAKYAKPWVITATPPQNEILGLYLEPLHKKIQQLPTHIRR